MNTKIKVALKVTTLTPESKVTKAQGIVDDMQASGNFPSSTMPISYSAVQNMIDNLQSSILAANSGTPADTSNMHEQERILVSMLNILKAHVEFVANNTSDPTTIIVSAGMQVAANGGGTAVTELTLQTAGNGSVSVKVPRGKDDKAFIFEKSTDGTTFTKEIITSLSSISISGLQPGSTIYVRYSAIGKSGEGQPSQAKSIIAL